MQYINTQQWRVDKCTVICCSAVEFNDASYPSAGSATLHGSGKHFTFSPSAPTKQTGFVCVYWKTNPHTGHNLTPQGDYNE